jgi:hypothetical protein
MAFKRWLYQGKRPNFIAKVMNSGWAIAHSMGIAPNYLVTLEVPGRQSGKIISFPLVMLVLDGERYLVSMLGEQANWVKNIRAAGGKATLRHGIREAVTLQEVDVAERPPLIKAYLKIAPGARPHIPVDKDAPLGEFEKVAGAYPVFEVKLRKGSPP